MSMVTSCPACATTFRVSPDQLKHREGKVRCGRCRSVFDAFKSLASLADEPPAELSAPAPEAPRDPPTGPGMQQALLDIEGTTADGARGVVALGGPAEPPRRSARRLLRPIAIVLLAALLALQLVYALRDRISAAAPTLRPALEALCAVGGCTVLPPKRTEQLAIESSDLKADPARPNRITLTAAVRNRGTSVVAHPAIELTLTNAQDQALVRRIFLPADYLPQPQDVQRGMAGLAEVNVRIELDTGELRPAGYRLFLFYP